MLWASGLSIEIDALGGRHLSSKIQICTHTILNIVCTNAAMFAIYLRRKSKIAIQGAWIPSNWKLILAWSVYGFCQCYMLRNCKCYVLALEIAYMKIQISVKQQNNK